MAERTTAIQTRGLSKSFGGRLVLRRLDLDVAEGERVALTGANGAGKTTLLRCLASILRPSSGEVRWFGQPAAANPPARRLIAMVGHETRLYPHLSVRENLIFAARMCDVGQPARRADQLLERIALRPHAHRFPAQLSRGMRQRVAIVRALVHDPRILLLDEPFSGLDQEAAEWLTGLLRDLHARQRTVCVATHDRHNAEQLSDRVLRLSCGRAEEVRSSGETVFQEVAPKARAA